MSMESECRIDGLWNGSEVSIMIMICSAWLGLLGQHMLSKLFSGFQSFNSGWYSLRWCKRRWRLDYQYLSVDTQRKGGWRSLKIASYEDDGAWMMANEEHRDWGREAAREANQLSLICGQPSICFCLLHLSEDNWWSRSFQESNEKGRNKIK